MKQIVCPNCKGTKITEAGNKYRCLYCGATFTAEDESKEPQQAPAPTQQVQPQVIYIQQQPAANAVNSSGKHRVSNKSRTTAAILALLLGGLGVHCFYMGKTFQGLWCLALCWTWIPTILGVIAFIQYICMSDEEFDLKYNHINL